MEDIELSGATYFAQSANIVIDGSANGSLVKHTKDIEFESNRLSPSYGLPTQNMMVKDYLAISPLVGKFSWKISAAAGDTLCGIEPCPALTMIPDSLSGVACSTPLSFLDRYFVAWRGSLIYTFKVVTSRFHSGSLRVTWDPLTTDRARSNEVITKIVNVAEEREFEFIVPYDNKLYATPTDDGLSYPTNHFYAAVGDTPVVVPSVVTKHGFLSVRVMNVLTNPNATDVDVLVFCDLDPISNSCKPIMEQRILHRNMSSNPRISRM